MSTQVENVIALATAEAAQRRQQAAVRYGELLARKSSPQKGDGAALLAAAQALGRAIADLPADAELVSRLMEAETLAAQVEGLQSERAARHMEPSNALRWVETARRDLEQAIEAKIVPLTDAKLQADHALSIANQAEGNLPRLRDRWAALVLGVSLEALQTARHEELAGLYPPALKGPGLAIPDASPDGPAAVETPTN